MNGLKDLVGRKFHFERLSSGTVTPTHELPSATWFHSDGSTQTADCPTGTTSYSKADSEFTSKSLESLVALASRDI
jgi:hypothetical protein